MKISVIMPAYNAQDYLREAIDSVLEQSYGDFEFIILNDCSTDDTEKIILSYDDPRIVYLKNEENLGVARTLNRGLDIAKGEYIARTDADDNCLPGRFAKQVAYLDSHPEVDVLGTASRSFDESGTLFFGYPTIDPEILRIDFLFSCGICHPTVMLRRSTIEKHQLRYDHAFNKVEDYEMWCRMLDLGCCITNLPDVLLDHRLHKNQVTNVYSPDMLEKLNRLHQRQLAQAGVTPDPTEEQAFLQYCLGIRRTQPVDYKALNNLLEKLLISNTYNRKKLRTYCEGIILCCMNNSCPTAKEKRQFIASSNFLNRVDIWKHTVRTLLKRDK